MVLAQVIHRATRYPSTFLQVGQTFFPSPKEVYYVILLSMNPYYYANAEFHPNLQLRRETKRWFHYRIDFPVAEPTRYQETNTVRGEYFRPQDSRNAPLAILIHGWGDHSIIPCKLLARSLVKRGIASFVLYLPFHSCRLPEEIRKRLPNLTPEEWFRGYQISVTDIRRIVDWAGNAGGINEKQVAVIGLSLGGFVSAIAMGIDKRIAAGIFLVSGGNSDKLMHLSRVRSFRKDYGVSDAEYHQNQENYTEYLSKVVKDGFENVVPDRQSYLTDPLTFAHLLSQRPVLMINALWDEFIPRESTLDFWEASGNPAISWFPATHASVWLWYPLIRRRIVDFLTNTFSWGEENQVG